MKLPTNLCGTSSGDKPLPALRLNRSSVPRTESVPAVSVIDLDHVYAAWNSNPFAYRRVRFNCIELYHELPAVTAWLIPIPKSVLTRRALMFDAAVDGVNR